MAVRSVPITLDGKEWALRCTLGAMAAVEDHGTTWQDLLEQLKGPKPSLKATQMVIWAMLQPGPSMDEVGTWVDPGNFADVLEAVSNALRSAFPPEKPNGRPPKGRGTGTVSSVSPTAHSVSTPTPSGA